MAERSGFRLIPTLTVVSEADIAKFCGGCDNLNPSNVCTLPAGGAEDQPRCVARKWCGWASQSGVRGIVTGEGFKPSEAPKQG